MEKDIKEKIDKLRKEIKKHNEAYYLKENPLISDFEYDELFRELKKLEDKFPTYNPSEKMTTKVSGGISKRFEPYRHAIRMYSLDNSNNYEDLKKFDTRVKKELGIQSCEYVCELKIDGLACSLTYEKGVLTVGATRGDGAIGENITENIKTVHGICHKLKEPLNLQVRGEVFMKISSFETLNAESAKKGEKIFANPRNAASGSLRQLDIDITKQRNLEFFAYDVIFEDENFMQTRFKSLKKLEELGFSVNKTSEKVKSIEEAINFCQKWEDKRFSLDYPTDGVVVKVDNLSFERELGFTSRAPKWATAFKFPPEEVWTTLNSVEFSVGKSGAITPVANLKPVKLAGTIVKRASLHNFDEIQRLKLSIGDDVLVKKAAEIIPKVVDSRHVENQHYKIIEPPKFCPSCNSVVVRPENEVNYYCVNPNCAQQKRAKLEFFASKDAMDIEGFGPSIIEQLYNKKMVENFSDFYKLQEEDFLKLDLIKEKSASNLFQAIQKSKHCSLQKFLTALGIKHVGKETAFLVCEKFDNIDQIKNAGVEDFESIEGIGLRIAESLYDYFHFEENLKVIDSMLSLGVEPISENKKIQSENFKGKTFVITGTLSKKRQFYEEMIKSHGGKTSNSVSKNTSFLLAGENPGSKFDKAKLLHIIILSEDEFLEMLKEK